MPKEEKSEDFIKKTEDDVFLNKLVSHGFGHFQATLIVAERRKESDEKEEKEEKEKRKEKPSGKKTKSNNMDSILDEAIQKIKTSVLSI